MKQFLCLIIWVFTTTLFSSGLFAQKKEIKVQIMHEDQVVLDTTLYKTSSEAKVIIENLVQQFSREPVTIDTKLTHGLYVFNISNDTWIDPQQAKTGTLPADAPKPTQYADKKEEEAKRAYDDDDDFDDIDVDSLFREFSSELSSNWNEAHIDIMIDSVGRSFEKMWEEMKKADFKNDPDIQNLKQDFKELFEKIKTTKFIIVQDGDTLKID